MADIDTGKVERMSVSADALCGGSESSFEDVVYASDYDALAADRDRLSRELAEARKESGQWFVAHRDGVVREEKLEQQLAESERLAAARNQLNGELGARLTEVELRVTRIHRLLKRGERTEDHGLIGNLACIEDHLLPDFDALTAPATPKVAQPDPAFTHDAEGRKEGRN